MDKLIDDIIELILGNVDCHHEVDHDEDGIHTSVEYNLNNETKLRGMIGKLIQKPGVTEEWIIEKACEASRFYSVSCKTVEDSRNFVCSLVEEIP